MKAISDKQASRQMKRLNAQIAYLEGCHGKAPVDVRDYDDEREPMYHPESAFGGDGPWNCYGGDMEQGELISQADYAIEQANARVQGCLAGTNHFWF